jgi:two-component system response regulator
VLILLIEDDPGDAQAALRVLRESGTRGEVHWVKDGEEALDFLFCSGQYAGRDPDQPPKLVLLDVKMPRIDGIEVLRRMRGSQLRSVPVIMMTSSNEERDVLESYRLGADAYLLKPMQREAFLAAAAKLGLVPGA